MVTSYSKSWSWWWRCWRCVWWRGWGGMEVEDDLVPATCRGRDGRGGAGVGWAAAIVRGGATEEEGEVEGEEGEEAAARWC